MWTACPPPALLSHVGCVWSCVGPKRAPGAEFCAAFADGVAFGRSCRIYVRVSSCSCVLSVSCDERACPRCVPVHGRRKFASMYVKQSGSTLFQYHTFDCRAWFGTKPRPRRAISVSGIRLEPIRRAASRSVDFASETPHASVRASGGSLSIPQVTRYHAMVG